MVGLRGMAIVAVLGMTACMQAVVPQPDLPGCDETTDFAFAGETSLAELGFEQFASHPDGNRRGMVWITAGPVSVDPGGGPVDPGGMPLLARTICVQWPDGSGMTSTIEDSWQPPPALAGAGAGRTPAIPVIVVLLVALAAIGVSLLAFRRSPTREG